MKITIGNQELGLSTNLITLLEWKKRTGTDFITSVSNLHTKQQEPGLDFMLDLILSGHSAHLKATTGQYLSEEKELEFMTTWDMENLVSQETQQGLETFIKKLTGTSGLKQVVATKK